MNTFELHLFCRFHLRLERLQAGRTVRGASQVAVRGLVRLFQHHSVPARMSQNRRLSCFPRSREQAMNQDIGQNRLRRRGRRLDRTGDNVGPSDVRPIGHRNPRSARVKDRNT